MITCSTFKRFQLLKRLTSSTPSAIYLLKSSTVQLFHRSIVPPLNCFTTQPVKTFTPSTVPPFNCSTVQQVQLFHFLTISTFFTVFFFNLSTILLFRRSTVPPIIKFNLLNLLPPQSFHRSIFLPLTCSTFQQVQPSQPFIPSTVPPFNFSTV